MPENLPQDFGGHLRQAREARGTTLRQIATATKISVHALEALERNDLSRLPGGIFTRAFVRAYAKEVGLDPDRTLAVFVARFPDESLPGSEDGRADVLARREPADGSARGPLNLMRLLVSLGLLIVFFLVFGRLFLRPSPSPAAGKAVDRQAGEISQKPAANNQGANAAAAPSPTAGALPGQPAPAQPAPRTTAAPAAQPLAAVAGPEQPQAAATTPLAASAPARPDAATEPPGERVAASGTAGGVVTEAGEPANARLTMEIMATGACWISATLDGGRTVARLLAPGERAVLRAADAIVIRVGDAGSFTYTLNGEAGRPLGGRGQVVTERIDTSNVQAYLIR